MKNVKKITMLGALLLPIGAMAVCNNTTTYEITTGSKTGTYIQIGKNLAKYVAPDACIKLNVLTSKGSLDNVFKLISPKFPKLKFAIIQNDVLQELEKRANKGESKSKKLFESLRVIKPLYNEEIHILVRANSNINTFGDLKGKRIGIATAKSGTAMTSKLLYKELFNEDMQNIKYKSFDENLKDLLKNKTVDAVIKVAGQPTSRLSKKMGKNADKQIKLISYDEKSSKHSPVESYYTADIYAKNYPWLHTDVNSLTTKAFLVTYNYKNKGTTSKIKKFVESLNRNLPSMQNNSSTADDTPHTKWKQVTNECNPALPGGWKYHNVVNEVCGSSSVSTSTTSSGCSADDREVGLCK